MMNENSVAHARYWCNSLADAELGSGALLYGSITGFLSIEKNELAIGHAPPFVIDKCFQGEPAKIQAVQVVIRPKVYLSRLEHGKQRRAGAPDIVTPVVTRALLGRDGRLYPTSLTVVPRDILEPLELNSFTIGTVGDQDEFLTKNRVPGIPFGDHPEENRTASFAQQWSQYSDACEQLFRHVGQGWPSSSEDNFELADFGYLAKEDLNNGTRQHVIALYDRLIAASPSIPLFDRYADGQAYDIEPCLPAHARFSARLGHPSDTFPLSQGQRDALAHMLVAKPGEILAVNGPPGTGKTTLLLSVVATLWSEAALRAGEPPVIVAASSNNQPVTNIIDAFGKDFSGGTGSLANRWLPDIKSFGGYYPSRKKEAEQGKKYQTRSFFDKVESVDYVAAAARDYLQAGARAFTDLPAELISVETIVARLHQAIRLEAEKLQMMEDAWSAAAAAQDGVREELGNDPMAALELRRQQLATSEEEEDVFKRPTDQWAEYLANEPIVYALFCWLPPVAKKRLRRALLFLKEIHLLERLRGEWQDMNRLEGDIKSISDQFRRAVEIHRTKHQKAQEVLRAEQEAFAKWHSAFAALDAAGDSKSISIAEGDNRADNLIRFKIFLLTTHYWEGRWLLEMQSLLPNLEEERKKVGRIASEKRWRRRMKLTPCIVSTFFMLPSLMKVRRREEADFVDDYLYDFADLLIVDEAGQVLPEVAGASFALSKKALVIGDTLQIEPIWSIPTRVDIGNLRKTGLLPEDDNDDAYKRFTVTGKSASSGSVMQIAQRTSRYHYDRSLARGMFLYEHRRCFDEIIQYCNLLCYRNKLIPKRGSKAGADRVVVLPALGYLHIDGMCQQTSGSSRHNALEAETIAAWLVEHRGELERQYRKPLHEVVGVITPFSSQVQAIIAACGKLHIKAGHLEEEVTVGTVHSLQGTERTVIIFSSVYSKHANGEFIDKSVSMLNVAVSRAKDSFLVFGDMDVFEVVSNTKPRGLLATLLFQSKANALDFGHRPRPDLKTSRIEIRHLRDAQEHDAFLLNALANVAGEIQIVTPWIRLECVESIGAMDAMSSAVKRGVAVSVYTDPEFNTDVKNPHMAAEKRQKLLLVEKALRERGVKVSFVRRVHSKAVMGDEDLYCVGSFNWFSASRDDRYARHETSLVYRGPDLADEIRVMRKSLSQRITHHLQSATAGAGG